MTGGIGSGIVWVLYGLYMAEHYRNVPTTEKGKYFSISSSIINFRYIGSPLLIIFGLGMANEKSFFFILAVIAFLAIPYPLLFLPNIDLRD